MRILNKKIISAQTNATANGPAIYCDQIYSASFIGAFSDGTAAGTLKVQASNDVPTNGNFQTFVPTNWADVPSATVAVTAGGVALVPMPTAVSYQWLRAVWTRSAGAGTFDVFINFQGF